MVRAVVRDVRKGTSGLPLPTSNKWYSNKKEEECNTRKGRTKVLGGMIYLLLAAGLASNQVIWR